MRADRAALDALLLAIGAYDQLHIRTRRQMDDQSHQRHDPAENGHQLRVLRLPALRVIHDPDADEDPSADANGDHEQVDETTDTVHSKNPCDRGGRDRRGSGVRRSTGGGSGGRGHSLRKQIGDREKQRKAGQNSFHVHLLRDFSHPLST